MKKLLGIAVLLVAAAAPAQSDRRDTLTERALGPAEVRDLAQGSGVIRSIDSDGRHVVIQHGPIPEMVWPASERRMAVFDPELLRGLKPGQRVEFTIDHTGLIRILRPLR
jgi:Cu(I)/Ag(I) efflux system protein CusF